MYSDDLRDKVREIFRKNRSVSSKLDMALSTVYYMVNNDYSRLKKKTGPRKIITPKQATLIKLEVKRLQSKKHRVFARKIKEKCKVEASVRTVQRAMTKLGLTYKKIPQKLPLTDSHKKERVEFARKWIGHNVLSKNVVFSDEKRFSFDGPDNWFSWYDPFHPPQRIKRQMGGGGVMVWGNDTSKWRNMGREA